MGDTEIKKQRPRMTTTQIIACGFIIMILVGALLLTLPIASADGKIHKFCGMPYLTSTTASCVDRSCDGKIALEHWSFFGHVVILFLIQFGGLGVITFTTIFLLVLGRRITLRQRMLIQDAYNLNTLRGLVKLTLKVIKGTVIFEGAGRSAFND